jgi:hypothetical protein
VPTVPKKYQTAGQKRKNKGTNIPWKYMTAGQKAHANAGKKKYSKKRYKKKRY